MPMLQEAAYRRVSEAQAATFASNTLKLFFHNCENILEKKILNFICAGIRRHDYSKVS